MTEQRYIVTRTETVTYSGDYSRADLEGLGVPAYVFDGLGHGSSIVKALERATEDFDEFRDALVEDTERHGNVQGQEFEFSAPGRTYDHEPVPDDLPEDGDRCKTCGEDVIWTGPGMYDYLHVDDKENQ